MPERLTLKQLLEKAIEKEIESQYLYAYMGKKATSQVAKDTFAELEQQEQGHEEFLERYQRGELAHGAIHLRDVLDYKIAENTDPAEITPDMQLKDIYLIAANREKAAHEAYIALAQAHPFGRVRELLEDLAAQELTHKKRLEFLYTETAFPQTDGG